MARTALFYHIWAPDGPSAWPLLVDEQLKRIHRSQMPEHADIFCCISGPAVEKVARLVTLYKWIKLVAQSTSDADYEGYTLKHLYEYSQKGRYDSIGYIHTKGLSYTRPDGDPVLYRNSNSWRHMMETVIIDRWRQVTEKLETHDVCGANFRTDPWPHFSGNFWWATAKYLRLLPHPVLGLNAEHSAFEGNKILQNRTKYERWIGINNPSVYECYNLPIRFNGKNLTASEVFDLTLSDIGPYYLNNLK